VLEENFWLWYRTLTEPALTTNSIINN